MVSSYEKYGDRELLESLVSGKEFTFCAASEDTIGPGSERFSRAFDSFYYNGTQIRCYTYFKNSAILPKALSGYYLYQIGNSTTTGIEVYAPSRTVSLKSEGSSIIKKICSPLSSFSALSAIKISFLGSSLFITSLVSNSDFPTGSYSNLERLFFQKELVQNSNWVNESSISLPSLKSIYASHYESLILGSCPNLTRVSTHTFYLDSGNYCKVDLHDSLVTSLAVAGNSNCSISLHNNTSLSKLVIYSQTQVGPYPKNSSCFNNTPIGLGEGVIQVPVDLVSKYQTYTNWSLFASQITAISGEFYLSDYFGMYNGWGSYPRGITWNFLITGFSNYTIPWTEAYSTATAMSAVYTGTDVISSDLKNIAVFMTSDSSVTPIDLGSAAPPNLESFTLLKWDKGALGDVWPLATGYFSSVSSLRRVACCITADSLPNHTFYNCTALESILPVAANYTGIFNISSIGDYAFYNCYSLTSAYFISASRTTSIGNHAFENCSSIPFISIPSVVQLGESAFRGCTSLLYAELALVTSIPDSVFTTCTSLEYINCPQATSFGHQAFMMCSSLTKFEWDDTVEYLVTSVGTHCFYQCLSLTRVNFPRLKTLNVYSFGNCSNLTSIDLSKVVGSIDSSCFTECKSLSKVESLGVTQLGNGAFSYCTGLLKVRFPRLNYIGSGSLCGCSILNKFDAPLLTSMTSDPLSNSEVSSIILPLATSYGNCRCWNVREVFLPLVTYTYSEAFDAYSLSKFYLPRLRVLGSEAFYQGFSGMPSPCSIVFDRVTSLGSQCLSQNYNLTEVTFKTPTVVAALATDICVRSGITSSSGHIYVPEELVSEYLTATNWGTLRSKITAMSLEYSFNDICNLSGFSSQYLVTGFSYNGDVVTYPVTSGAAFFSTLGFEPLTASTVPNDCEYLYIGSSYVTAPTVCGITSLKEISLATEVTVLPDNFASGCSALVRIEDHDSLLSLGENCFYECSSLTKVEFVSVTSVPSSAFYGCSSLTEAFIYNASSVGSNAFNSCTSLISAIFPKAKPVDMTAFSNCYNINYAPHPKVSSLSELGIQAVVVGEDIYRDSELGWLFPPVAGYEWNEAFIPLTPRSSITFRNCTSVPTGIYNSNFSDLWLLGSSVASLSSSTIFDGSLITTTGHIHVWRDVIDQYLVATNWSALASRITVITVSDEIDFDFPKEES